MRLNAQSSPVFWPWSIRVPFYIFSLLLIAGCNQQVESPPADQVESAPVDIDSPLLGEWQVMSINDRQLSDLDVNIQWSFSKDEIVVADSFGQEISRSRYHTDMSYTPHHIDKQIRDIYDEDRRGIFEVDGDRLRISFSLDGGHRPKEFDVGETLMLQRDP